MGRITLTDLDELVRRAREHMPTIELQIYGEPWCTLHCPSAEQAQRFANGWVAEMEGRSAVVHLPAATPSERLRLTIERAAEVEVPRC